MIEGTTPPQDAANESDILNFYRLFLRREPESAALSHEGAPPSLASFLKQILLSDEFCDANLGPLRTGHVPHSSLDAPPIECLEWATERLKLGDQSKQKLKISISYLQAYSAILSDEALLADLATHGDFYDQTIQSVLDAASRLQALTDVPNSRTLTGWARSLDAIGAPIPLEIWANGRYLGRVVTGLYRQDAATRLKSSGFEGFQFELPRTISGRARILVRDEKSKLILTDIVVDVASADPDALTLLRQEIKGIQESIRDLETRLPRSLGSATYPIELYGEYYDIWIRRASLDPGSERDAAIIVLLDGVGCEQSAIEDAIWSLVEQSHKAFSVIIGILQRDLAFLQDLIARVRWRRDLSIDYVVTDDGAAWRVGAALPPDVEIVQLMDACGTIHRDALRCMAAPFLLAEKPAAVYGDEDAFVSDDLRGWRDRAHVKPILKPDMDYDLLLQTPYTGSFVAFEIGQWSTLKARAVQDGWADLFLPNRAMLEVVRNEAKVAHVCEILFTTAGSPIVGDVQAWAGIVQDTLGDTVATEPHKDILGADVERACRVRWRPSPDASAVVIIPTRDRLDLLQPCIDSILANLDKNQTSTRVHIVDHDSVEENTLSYLESLRSHKSVNVKKYSGHFNWALMNNLAVHQTEEDVLIFLNNDTSVITPDWIDEIVSLAMRVDVGVVGCRLIYDDGAIQHAGFLALDERRRFLSHDGIGESGSSPGYLGRNALVHRTVAVTGACMAVRRDVFRRIGGFDAARFQIEGNDVDLCFKAADLGLKVLYTPFATLHHFESRTRIVGTEQAIRLSEEAAERIWVRWGHKVCPDPWYNVRFDRGSSHFSRLAPR